MGVGVHRRECSRRKTPNLFGQAALQPEGLGRLGGSPPLPDTLNYNSGALCVEGDAGRGGVKGGQLTCPV